MGSLYKPVCEFHNEILNFVTTLRSSEQSSKSFSENLTEIDNNTSKKRTHQLGEMPLRGVLCLLWLNYKTLVSR